MRVYNWNCNSIGQGILAVLAMQLTEMQGCIPYSMLLLETSGIVPANAQPGYEMQANWQAFSL